jgi:ABC-2 type transport system permease protein
MARQLVSALRGKRAAAVALLGALPVALALLLRSPDPVVTVRIVALLHLLLLLPILAISLGSGLFYDEAEEGTLTYLWATPIPRAAVVVGKWAAVLGIGWAILLASLGATLLAAPAPDGPRAANLAPFGRASFQAVALAYPAYLGLFVLVGALFRHGFVAGLLYFAYEFVIARIPAALKYASLRYYVDSLVYPVAPDKQVFMGEFDDFLPSGTATCAAVLLGTALAGLALAILLAQVKEFRSRNVQG